MQYLSQEQILGLPQKDDNFLEIREYILDSSKKPYYITGPCNSMKSYLMAALLNSTQKKLCVLVSDELRARELYKELSAYKDYKVIVFRPREYNLVDVYASSKEEEFNRLRTIFDLITDNFDVCIITAAASVSKLIPRKDFLENIINLKIGQSIAPQKLTRFLADLGYEKSKISESPGQFSARGDLVDIVLPFDSHDRAYESMGIRLSFFDDTIDAIKIFDTQNQRSTEMIDEISIFPAREIIIKENDLERIKEEIFEISKEYSYEKSDYDIERISTQNYFQIADKYLPVIYPSPDSVFEYIPQDAIFVVDEPPMVETRMDGFCADYFEKYKALLEKHKILPLSDQMHFHRHEILKRIDEINKRLYFSIIPSGKKYLSEFRQMYIPSKEGLSYRGQEDKLEKEIKHNNEIKKETILLIGDQKRADRISSYLDQKQATSKLSLIYVEEGFEYTGISTIFIGANQIFGKTKRGKRKFKKGISIDLLSDLKPGEIVVHEDHGVGKYIGLENIDSNGIKRDYIRIDYDKSDTLYIPMESFDKIQKYIGTKGKAPKLSKLGGQEWGKSKERAKSSIRKLATNLVELYAKRMELKGTAFSKDTVWQKDFEDNFEYEETYDQIQSIEEIKSDMESDKVMDRLLCGDVGFGKTEVAFRAAFKCVMEGKQAAFLVPTTVLAKQHFDNLVNRLQGFPVRVGHLSRFASDAMIKQTKRELAAGTLEIVVGTHRVLSKDVEFKDLGLLVVDEEQRFGVDHKEMLKERFPTTDVLTLTATPIPRTLHMSIAGIRDISIIEDPPVDRRPVQTFVMEFDEEIINDAMLQEISRNGQVFYLFNNTSKISQKAAEIQKQLKGARVSYAHGKMPEKDLEDIINAFINHEFDILVCTTIIESGIDMPNVNTIIVENADRLGLAQLYQLRGRVGRSQRQAFSYITYKPDKVLSEIAQQRLAAIRDFTELGSGFKIALRDLEVRGAGDLLGAKQHGNMDAIGYDLYCKILEEQIKLASGEEIKPKFTSAVEFKIDAYIPKKYIPNEGQRMDMYRRIAQIKDTESYLDVWDELTDRYGDLPSELETLTDIAYIKNYSVNLGFEKVFAKDGNVVLSYRDNFTPDIEIISAVLNMDKYKGMLLFNAQSKPYLIYRASAKPINKAPQKIRDLFADIEKITK